MYKKIIILVMCFLCLGCAKKQEKKIKKVSKPEIKDVYKDENNMPIGLYQIKSYGVLQRVKDITSVFDPDTDIAFVQVYPSNEEQIKLDNGFGEDFYKKWQEYNKDNNHKLGFNVKYKIVGNKEISFNIYDPDTAMTKLENILVYLYDDYTNRNESWYDHIKQEELDKYPYITAIKLTANGKIGEVISDVDLTVFTYDSDDDFDENKNYRGNSKYTITIHQADS